MNRLCTIIVLISFAAAPAFAEDNGGFGPKFTQNTPSALMETPTSVIAQSVQDDASAMQDIMPAAGDETPSAETNAHHIDTNGQRIIEAAPTTINKSMESHMTVPSSQGK